MELQNINMAPEVEKARVGSASRASSKSDSNSSSFRSTLIKKDTCIEKKN